MRGPPERRDEEGTFSDVANDLDPVRSDAPAPEDVEVVFESGTGTAPLLRLPKLIPEKDGNGILDACSSSSIGGKSSSLAENRPVLGEVALELL